MESGLWKLFLNLSLVVSWKVVIKVVCDRPDKRNSLTGQKNYWVDRGGKFVE